MRAWHGAQGEDDFAISVLTIGKIKRGIGLLRSRDPEQPGRLERWLGELKSHYQPLPDGDGLLPATALVHDLTMATRNTRDFSRSGVLVGNPFLFG